MKVFIDCDGTILKNWLDEKFSQKIKEVGIEKALDWYRDVYVDDLPINWDLVRRLLNMSNEGHTLILWTNRSESKREMTKENLGKVWFMFDEYRFRGGQKGKDDLDGIVFDNNEKYLDCGKDGVLIDF